jgi:selenocysteine-specific elongation factor
MDRYVILGTAGHIDHGKSALVRALTGTDPDRLKEEKERGITIDLGFADLAFSDGLKVGIVDVPGHERLIKNMLAGAGGIDIVIMVIAADEGIMPQSREHLDICNLLKVKRGLIAVTKSDLVEADWLELVRDEIKSFVEGTFLEDAEIISVSSKTGHNIEVLKEKIRELALDVEPKSINGIFRLPVDRIFTLKGFGTVITGTAISGSISLDAPVEILPAGIKTKVRGLQSHGETLRKAFAGQRVAMNLQGVSKDEIQRGDVITVPEKIKTSNVIDAELDMLKDSSISTLKSRSLVHFHTGTTELTGRIIIYDKDELKPGDKAYCQFRFKIPIAVMAGDRYIIRRFSPLLTIGGGKILDTTPRRLRRNERVQDLEIFRGDSLDERLALKIRQSGVNGLDGADLIGWVKEEIPVIKSEISLLINEGTIIDSEGRLIHHSVFDDFRDRVLSTLEDFHKKNPLKPGILKEALRAVFKGMDQKVFESLIRLIKNIVIEKEILRLELAKSVSIQTGEAGELLKIMASENTLVRINDSLYIPMTSHSEMMKRLQNFFDKKKDMSVAEFRDVLGTSRKYAIPFLEYLDSNKITLRVGEVRKFLKKLS